MKLPGFIARNFKLKLACTFVATVTWVGVVYAGNPPETKTVSVPVPQSRALIPAQFVLVTPIAPLSVRIGGSRDSLNAFNASSLVVTVAWRTVTHPGFVNVPISITKTDPNIELIDAPTSVAADIDTQDSVTVPVTIKISNPPPPGYTISTEASAPSSVTVVGPHHLLSGLEARVTVDLQNRKTNLVADLAVLIYDAQGAQVADLSSVTPNIVTVTVTVASSLVTRASAVLPKTVGTVAAGFEYYGISADPATVVLSGSQDLLNGLDSIATEPISISGLTGNETVTVPLAPPAGVSVQPSTVTVTILVVALPPPRPSPTPTPTPTPTPSPTTSPAAAAPKPT